MFTGIILGTAAVAKLTRHAGGARLAIDPGELELTVAPGDSVCVSGCCLTHCPATAGGGVLEFDVIKESVDRTTLGGLRVGSRVNIETSLTPVTPMGGHFVQGHVDGVGRITRVAAGRDETRVTVEPPADLMPYIVPKGSIAIDGISLTIAAVGGRSFEVALIPTTLKLTTLGQAKAGHRVNLETDIIAKTVVNWLTHYAGGTPAPGSSPGSSPGSRPRTSNVTEDVLRNAGFTL